MYINIANNIYIVDLFFIVDTKTNSSLLSLISLLNFIPNLAFFLYTQSIDFDIIDSTWFTTLINSSAFNVRGHFRLQPFGTDLKEKKLIWIKEFQKSGYKRIAKKEKKD